MRFMTSMLCTLLVMATGAVAGESPRINLDIKPQPIRLALKELGKQTGLQIMFRTEDVAGDGMVSPALKGELTASEALARMLKHTGLTYQFVNPRMIWVSDKASASGSVPPQSVLRLARVSESDAAAAPVEATESARPPTSAEDSRGVPEILVKGTRTSNTDIRRTEDDVQPYVVFDAEEIGRSMTPDLETFLRTRLPMNQARDTEAQNFLSARGNQSTIDLRGLGADQTLILVNGRRMPGVASGNYFEQPDINGIPLSAVERIEILPSTAGGIYGGGATGGVVNIILKRNYNDLELTARYDGTFDGGGAERRLDATAGFSLEGGRTNVMVMGSYRDGNPLYLGERDFAARSRALQAQNDYSAIAGLFQPIRGYTTNIRSINGSDLVLKEGMVSLNSNITHVPVGYAGPASDNGAAFLGTAGRYNLALGEDPLGSQFALLNAPSVRSLQFSVRREFTDHIEAFVDVSRYDSRTERRGSQLSFYWAARTLPVGPANPFNQAVQLSVPLVGYEDDAYRTLTGSLSEQIAGGVIVRLPRDWTAQAEYSLGRSTLTYKSRQDALTVDGNAALIDGRLDPLRDINAYPLDYSGFYPGEDGRAIGRDFPVELNNATLRVSGPLLRLPGGPLRLAALLERREEFTGDQILTSYVEGGAPSYLYYGEVGGITDSGYIELNAPLVSAARARPGLLGFDVLASYRHDANQVRTRSSTGSRVSVPSPDGPIPDVPFVVRRVTGNQYTLGFRYTPMENVALRISYGEGILPPNSRDLGQTDRAPATLGFTGIRDPKRGGLTVDASAVERFTASGNLLLRPEQSASWSGGVIFTPASLPGLRVSVDYTRIEKTDEILAPSWQLFLDLEDDLPGYVERIELTAADMALNYTGGKIREFHGGPINIASSLMEAFDIQVDYRWETPFGSFAANVLTTLQSHLTQQVTPDGATMETVGYSNGPLKWRANAGLRFSRGNWDLAWNLQYYDASRVYTSSATMGLRDRLVLGQGSAWIPTQTYHDIYGRYRFENAAGFAGGLLENTELQVSVQNVLNTSPPILAIANSYAIAGYATEGDARLRRYAIAITKRFGR